MFRVRWLDALTRVHPVVPVLIFAPAIVALAVIGVDHEGAWNALGLAAIGYVAWTLSEYWIHRAIFHFEPERGWGARMHWMIHGVHHDHPNDPLRLVMPPSVSVPLAAGFYGLFVLVVGAAAAPALAAGFLGGYLVYDMTHYHVHHHRPRTRVGRLLRELHMRHHFQDDTTGYGISAPYWDRVFGTATRRRRP
jgi:sterol desaturase/sphingolipid hydroxylase (fatty acid hydroxylase superfamily)